MAELPTMASSDTQTWVAVTGTDHAVRYLNLVNNVPQTGWAMYDTTGPFPTFGPWT